MNPVWSIRLSAPPASAVKYLAAGDFCLDEKADRDSRLVEELYHHEVRALLADKSISTVGVEFPLVRAGAPIRKSGPHLSGSPLTIDALHAGHFDLACLANNHIRDFGPESVLQTRDLIHRSGIGVFGVGKDQVEASQPLVRDVDGVKIGFLAFAEEQFSCADGTGAGAAKLDPLICVNRMNELRDKVDVIAALVHGGVEFFPVPSPQAQSRYRFLVDCGADIVVGHHPHSIQGLEIYHGAPIFYSLGNFCLTYPSTDPLPRCWPFGMVVRLVLSREGVHELECFVVRHDAQGRRPRIDVLSDQDLEMFRTRMERLNQIVADAGLLREFWRCFCYQRGHSFRSELVGDVPALDADPWYLTKAAIGRRAAAYFASALAVLAWRFGAGTRARNAAMTRMCDLVRCPSHHDVLQTLLEMAMEGKSFKSPHWDECVQLSEY